ncbi:histidine kinase, partial [Streptomyces javensis]|nr:histidine kinase [Streptomyces javensis]
EYEPTGQFARPEPGGPPERRDPFGNRGPGDTGELPQLTDGPSMFEPRRAPSGPQAGQGLSDTGQFSRPDYGRGPGDTGEYARPELGQGPGDTGEYAQPRFEDAAPRGGRGPGDTGEFPRPNMGGPGDTGEYARPNMGGPGDTGEYARPNMGGPGDTGEFPRPDMSGTGEYALPQDSMGEPDRRTNDPLPPAGPGDGRTPIFDTIESTWHHPQVADPGNSGPRDGGRSFPSAPSAPE